MTEFSPVPIFPEMKNDTTAYRRLSTDCTSVDTFRGREVLVVDPEGLTRLAHEAFSDVNFLLRTSHLSQIREILDDPESTVNDRVVALELIKNAVISADRVFPMCQDTGTAIVMGKKGNRVFSSPGMSDHDALMTGAMTAYRDNCFRYSQMAALSMYDELNTRNNMPAQIDLMVGSGNTFDFTFVSKGGGSANKTFLFQETRAVLNRDTLVPFLVEKMKQIGTSACPPYHLAVVVGGTSAEMNLKTVKLATAKALDHLGDRGNAAGQAFRDMELEAELFEKSRALGLGAQFGGRYFCLDVRVIRLPRHGASCPVGIGVSCSADRNIRGKITGAGIFLENLETDPARFLPCPEPEMKGAVAVNLDQPMTAIRDALSAHPVGTPLLLSGTMIVARDIAHAKLMERLEKGDGLPDYFRNHPVYYAGPAKTPPGMPSGSFGPTTAGRMDSYVPAFQAKGASLVMLAKGNRGSGVVRSCRDHGGFYLGSIGGPAARLGKDCITGIEVIDFPELGMEAVHRITVRDFPAFILIDDKGNDFYQPLL